MADTKRSIRRNDASINRPRLFLVESKPVAGTFTPRVQQDIVYRFAWQRKEPSHIARDLSKGPVKTRTKDVNEVLRDRMRAAWLPEKEAA